MNYKEKLKSPLWQKKRLLIMERDNFSCQYCESSKNTLNVHHLYYQKSEPWGYPDEALITLCEERHAKEEQSMPEILNDLIKAAQCTCVPSWYMRALVSSLVVFSNNPAGATQFIIDIQKEAYKRNKVIDLSKIKDYAKTLYLLEAK